MGSSTEISTRCTPAPDPDPDQSGMNRNGLDRIHVIQEEVQNQIHKFLTMASKYYQGYNRYEFENILLKNAL